MMVSYPQLHVHICDITHKACLDLADESSGLSEHFSDQHFPKYAPSQSLPDQMSGDGRAGSGSDSVLGGGIGEDAGGGRDKRGGRQTGGSEISLTGSDISKDSNPITSKPLLGQLEAYTVCGYFTVSSRAR